MTPPTMIPCPFCENTDCTVFRMGDECWIACDKCGAEGTSAPTLTEAIEKWNTRPVEAALREALRPFAEFAEQWDDLPDAYILRITSSTGNPPAVITLGHLRAAARLLKEQK